MTRADLVPAARDEDTALIAELRRLLDEALRQLDGWKQSAQEALHTAGTALAVNKVLDERIAELEAEIEELRCGDVLQFHEGELAPARAEKFRAHLKRCAGCRQTIADFAVIDDALDHLAANRQPKEE